VPEPEEPVVNAGSRTSGWRRCRPEPGRWWIAQVPAAWPGAGGLWTHLADRALGRSGSGAVPTLDAATAQEVVYLPPVAPAQRRARSELATELRAAGLPVLGQCQPEEPGGADEVLDLLSTLVTRRVEGLSELGEGRRSAVWPLIPGLTDDEDDWARGLDRLAAAGLETVVPMPVALTPAERRELAVYTDDRGYQALFHGATLDERGFTRLATARGLGTTPARLPLASTPRREFCRRAATELAIVADLWLRLGRGEAAGQELLRAARWVEDSEHDLRALAREGNLGVLPWLEGGALRVVEDLVAERPNSLRQELEGEYSRSPR
jgi:hypothetical protein